METTSLIDIKKLFSKHGGVNFFNDFTLLDVEDAKKKVFFYLTKDKPSDVENIKNFLERGAKQIMEEKFMMGFEKPVGTVIKNTVRDNLNPDYKNTLKRLICIDSQYRPNLYPYNDPDTNECDFIVNLSEKLINVVNIQIENVQIPYTFYNIETRKGNNYFFVNDNLITVDDGHYTLQTLIDAINVKTLTYDISFNFDISLQKVSIQNKSVTTPASIVFFDSLDNQDANEANTKNTTYLTAKGNHNLGWILGFRNVLSDTDHIELSYTVAVNSTTPSEAIANITNTKYFTIVVNDYNQNQANGTVIQSKLETNYIKPSTYFNFQNTPSNKTLDCLTCNNINEYISAENRTLTKAQLYTRAEVNKYKTVMSLQNYRLDCKTQNQVLAVIPFDSTIDFGSFYFNDKIDYKREYHGPVDIEKLHIQMFDDKGLLMDLNGNDWCITMYTEHLYKY